ncbi:MAG TPA: zinc ribbon domain-containing protein [Candidatus Binataceae bacterium]|nr:zinc ribbon domain-containing protein [Candidatus Binataceae bacterium]
MPIYEYRCLKCEFSFEALVRPGHDDAECPQCGGSKLEREMSTFASRGSSGDAIAAAENAIAGNGGGSGMTGGGCCGGGGCGCH